MHTRGQTSLSTSNHSRSPSAPVHLHIWSHWNQTKLTVRMSHSSTLLSSQTIGSSFPLKHTKHTTTSLRTGVTSALRREFLTNPEFDIIGPVAKSEGVINHISPVVRAAQRPFSGSQGRVLFSVGTSTCSMMLWCCASHCPFRMILGVGPTQSQPNWAKIYRVIILDLHAGS